MTVIEKCMSFVLLDTHKIYDVTFLQYLHQLKLLPLMFSGLYFKHLGEKSLKLRKTFEGTTPYSTLQQIFFFLSSFAIDKV